MEQSVSSLTVSRGERLSALWAELTRRLLVLLTLGCLGLLISIMMATLWISAAHAAPAAPIEIMLKQPDGKTIAAKQYGDEWNNGFETTQGYTIVRDSGTGAGSTLELPAGMAACLRSLPHPDGTTTLNQENRWNHLRLRAFN